MNSTQMVVEKLKNLELSISKMLDNVDKVLLELWQIMLETPQCVVDEVLLDPATPAICDCFREHWNKFIEQKEFQCPSSSESHDSLLSRYGYSHLDEELNVPQLFNRPISFTMVGCGSYPETLLYAKERFQWMDGLIGVDYNEKSLQQAGKWCSGAQLIEAKGEEFDYSNSDFVFLANGLKNKGAVLKRVSETIPSGGVVSVRTPTRLAILIYEGLTEKEIPECISSVQSVQSSPLSKTMTFRKKPCLESASCKSLGGHPHSQELL